MLLSETTNGSTTNYDYGLERISALNGKAKTEYIYDGRGSVAAELSYTSAWYTLGGALSKADVTSKTYSPYGEQLSGQLSGFGYNGELYDAATGSIYLRARNYEPAMNRFSQKDILRGAVLNPDSLNRYLYVQNDPLNYIDPSGRTLGSFLQKAANKVTNAVKAVASNPVGAIRSAASTVKNAVQSFVANPVGTAKNAYTSAKNLVSKAVEEIRRPAENPNSAVTPSASTQSNYNLPFVPDEPNPWNAYTNPQTVPNTLAQTSWSVQDSMYCTLSSHNNANAETISSTQKNIKFSDVSIAVSIEMFYQAIKGSGEKQFYDEKSKLSKTLLKSQIMQDKVDQAFIAYKDSGGTNNYYGDSVSFYEEGNKYDFDLLYSVGQASYSVTISQETRVRGIWIFKKTEERLAATVTVEDTYNFDKYREDGSLGSILNNLGYDMQQFGDIKPYEWTAQYVQYSDWGDVQ